MSDCLPRTGVTASLPQGTMAVWLRSSTSRRTWASTPRGSGYLSTTPFPSLLADGTHVRVVPPIEGTRTVVAFPFFVMGRFVFPRSLEKIWVFSEIAKRTRRVRFCIRHGPRTRTTWTVRNGAGGQMSRLRVLHGVRLFVEFVMRL